MDNIYINKWQSDQAYVFPKRYCLRTMKDWDNIYINKWQSDQAYFFPKTLLFTNHERLVIALQHTEVEFSALILSPFFVNTCRWEVYIMPILR